jgi:hypothetical protein
MAVFGEIRDPLVGTRIDGRYLVQGVLGRGGMGVVYHGVHETLGRAVAIKVLGIGIAGDPTAVERFLREARTASQLTHSNIVDVSDLGALPDGRPYLVMAKVQGIDLCNLLETQGPQTPQRTAELLRGAAAALDLIHAKGYVHRDIKPENLMYVVREDGSEAVLLLDFGIVGLVSNPSARLTAEGSVFGTPAYLPPEVIQGDPPNPRADIYALATVAFELIAGRAPFVADSPLRILPMKLLETAPTLSKAAGYPFPVAIEEVVARGLARDPNDRHASAGAFIAELAAAAVAHASAPMPPMAARVREAELRAQQRMAETAALDEFEPAGAQQPMAATEGAHASSETDEARIRELEANLAALSAGLPELDRKRQTPTLDALGWVSEEPAPTRQATLGYVSTDPAAGLLKPDAFTKRAELTEVVQSEPSDKRALREDTAHRIARRSPWLPIAVLIALLGGGALWFSQRSSRVPTLAAGAASRWAPAEVVRPASPPTIVPSSDAPVAPATPVVSAPAAKPLETTTNEKKSAPRPPPTAAAREPQQTASRVSSPSAPRSPPRSPPTAAKPAGPTALELTEQAQHELVQGHLGAAVDLYTRATRIDPRSGAAFRGLGLASERLGHKAEAVRALRRALTLSAPGASADMLRERIAKLESAASP